MDDVVSVASTWSTFSRAGRPKGYARSPLEISRSECLPCFRATISHQLHVQSRVRITSPVRRGTVSLVNLIPLPVGLFAAYLSRSWISGAEAYARYSYLVDSNNLPFIRASLSDRVVMSAGNWSMGEHLQKH
jgi:hypothetical protein